MLSKERVKDLLNEAKGWDFEHRAGVCAGALQAMVKELSANDNDAIRSFIIALLRVAVSADRSCEQGEYDLYRAVIDENISGDDFYELTNGGSNPELIKAVDENIDSFTDDAKFACCTFVLCCLTADRDITSNEEALIQKLFA